MSFQFFVPRRDAPHTHVVAKVVTTMTTDRQQTRALVALVPAAGQALISTDRLVHRPSLRVSSFSRIFVAPLITLHVPFNLSTYFSLVSA